MDVTATICKTLELVFTKQQQYVNIIYIYL